MSSRVLEIENTDFSPQRCKDLLKLARESDEHADHLSRLCSESGGCEESVPQSINVQRRIAREYYEKAYELYSHGRGFFSKNYADSEWKQFLRCVPEKSLPYAAKKLLEF